MTKNPTLIGGISIIASVCVGAGMLGLPTAGAGGWLLWSTLALLLTMLVMTLSGWLLLEVLKHYDTDASFSTITQDLLGKRINYLNNLAVYFVGAILLYAYITSAGLILAGITPLGRHSASIVFVAIFAYAVFHSTRAVDRISVLLITFMIASFAFGIFSLFVHIDLSLIFVDIGRQFGWFTYALAMLPVALTSFGYHMSVFSLRKYYGGETQAQKAILGGTLISLVFYLVWLASVFGNVARPDFAPVLAQGGNVDALLAALAGIGTSSLALKVLSVFSAAAIFSSFIGVGLGLFDFMADLLGFSDDRQGRAKTWIATFIPPLLGSLFVPFGFVLAIGYAGAAAAFWTCIIPALLIVKARQRPDAQTGFMAPGGSASVWLVGLFGVVVTVLHFMTVFSVNPSPAL
ncbi:aromatic amino acid transporter [Halomonas sp. SpR1]|uniref:aromatic amino acid transporter n=1 Tax=Halomonas sp. SpR1 TaxID=3050462 RepID=UPI0027E4E89B|nr:aromatic amino acid transporter [Halomonas sp. SpR1]MDQ7731729.1 aromatic amino acid transporter [Halomonas sp. SpR1]